MFQYQKFGKRQFQSLNDDGEDNLNLELNIIPKSYQQQQFTEKQVIVSTPDFVGIMKFTTFKIIIQNKQRCLDFEETFKALQQSYEEIVNFFQSTIKFESNEIIADFGTLEIKNDYPTYELPKSLYFSIPHVRVVIEFPRIVMYSQLTNSQQTIKITNLEVMNLIQTSFLDLEQFHNRFNFTSIKIEVRKIRCQKSVNIYQNVSKLSLNLVPNNKKSQLKERMYLFQQVSIFGEELYISKFIPSQVKVLDEYNQERHCQLLSLEEFKLLCFYSHHKGLDLFLYYVKLISHENQIKCQLPEHLLKKYKDLNIFNDECMRNGLGRKIECNHNFNNTNYLIQLIPPKFIIYNPIDNHSTEIPGTKELLEILILNNYNVKFQIY